jgi:CRP-like cAMP-binding protein
MVSKTSPSRSSTASTLKNLRKDGDGNAIHNRILLGLPKKEYDLVLSKLVFLYLRLHDLLQEAGQPVQYCYFPTTAMASILNIMKDGKSIEVGLAGWEGFVGMAVVAGFHSSALKVVTQAQGTAFRINADDLRTTLRTCPQLVVSLMRYSQEATMEVTQIAACNRLHEMEERLARWLLMSQDRIAKDTLPLTQEFLSQMLGTRRASVSVAATNLQRAGLIQYNRGHVTILNREALKSASCECYGAIRKQLDSWQEELQ